MKPTNEQVAKWAWKAGLLHWMPVGLEFGSEEAELALRAFAALAYSAGAAAMKERAATFFGGKVGQSDLRDVDAAIRALGDEE